jgi:4,5-DOPA dioxygenase extradiol
MLTFDGGRRPTDDQRARRSTPAAFFGHGSPMNALDRNRYTQAW